MWNVIYVRSRCEKKVAVQLEKLGVTYFLALVKTKRLRTDRTVTVETPLFNGYVFVKATEKTRYAILNIPYVVKFIRHDGIDAIVDNKIIEGLQISISKGRDLLTLDQTNTNIKIGEKVKVLAGPFMGQLGEVTEINSKKYVRILIQVINQYVCVKINKNYLQQQYG